MYYKRQSFGKNVFNLQHAAFQHHFPFVILLKRHDEFKNEESFNRSNKLACWSEKVAEHAQSKNCITPLP